MYNEWQPVTWTLFHTITLKYKENLIEYKDQYINFFESFKTILPCKKCKNHYIENLNKEELNINNNLNRLFEWTVDLHNDVNKINDKKIWNYQEARDYYEKVGLTNEFLNIFIYSYIHYNYKKNPNKTGELIKMLNSLVYLHPDPNKREKLINFRKKFELNRANFKSWLFALLVIIKNK